MSTINQQIAMPRDEVLEYANLAGFPATGEAGKIYVALDTNKTYRWSGTAYVYITSGAVDSVAGKTGVVTLVKGDVGLGNVDNTSDANKPVSTAQQTAINLKANLVSPALTGTPTAPTATAGTNTTQLATTEFVTTAVSGKANSSHTHVIDDVSGLQTALNGKQSVNADLTSIAGLAGTSGFLKKTAANTWSLDTNAYITGNQGITVTGDASGSGTTSIALTLANSGATVGTYKSVTVDAKGRVTSGTNPTTLAGYGITDAVLSSDVVTTATASKILKLDANSKLPASVTGDADGNAATATKLATARTINGVSFDGSDNITINAVDSTSRIASSEKGVANGVATLGSDGKIFSSQLPSYVDDVLEYTNLAAFPTTGEAGKIYIALDTNKTYRWSGSVYVYITSGAVDSVAGKTGVVILAKADVGLNNVDNTSDLNKPISTTQQSALDLKANLASPALTGTPTAPTAAVGTSTTQIATTAFVNAEIANDAAPKSHVGATGTAHGVATTSVAGFMSSTDKTKLDGISAGANAYVHPTGDGNLHVPITGTNSDGYVLKAGATAGSMAWGQLTAADVGALPSTWVPNFSDINSKPTTLSGYGITDALSTSGNEVLPLVNADVTSASLTTSTTTANQVVDSFSSTTYRTAKYLIQATSGTSYHSCEALVIHDGTTASLVVYGDVKTGASLMTLDGDVSGGNVRLLATPANTATTIKVVRTSIDA